MKEVKSEEITKVIKDLCITANKTLPRDLVACISCAKQNEENETARSVLGDLEENIKSAKELDLPICQDTGMAVIFAEVGQDVYINGNFENAVNEGVRQGYADGFLRKSVVLDPLKDRTNTGDNTPAILHTRITDGNKIKLVVAPKGFGSENMSRIKMFTPSATREDVLNFVLETVRTAGSNPCPPVVVGVGIGGDFEMSAILAKKALCRDISKANDDRFYADLEQDMLEKINELDIGPQGFGGVTTALKVNIEMYATHIAGLPVAVNIGCHVNRHAEKEI